MKLYIEGPIDTDKKYSHQGQEVNISIKRTYKQCFTDQPLEFDDWGDGIRELLASINSFLLIFRPTFSCNY